MINCPNCGGLNGNGNPNCSFCGAPLINSPIDPNLTSIETPNNFAGPVYDNQDMGEFGEQVGYEPNINQEVFSNPANNMSNDEMFINAYIKKNVDKIKASGFSIWGFLFGGIYFGYRKMYKILLIWLGISLVCSIIFSITHLYFMIFIVFLAFNVFAGIKFKELYLKNVNVQVATIKSKNTEESPENLALICSKKGGTTLVPIIVFGALLLIIPIVVVLSILPMFGDESGSAEKKNAMVDEAYLMIDAARGDIIDNEVKDNSKTYDIDDLNKLLGTPLSNSPFGKSYVYAKVQAIKTMDGSYIYKICLIDEDRNGFGYTNEAILSFNSVLEKTAPDAC